ncbi:MAG: methyltransferase [bacterium]|nr:methyltransferase [bacterium]
MTDIRELVGPIHEIASAYRQSQILFAAVEGDVFQLLEDACTRDEIASATGWSPRGTAMLLDGLLALDLIVESNDVYHNGPEASECLVPGKPGYQGNIIRHQQGSYGAYAGLADAVRRGGADPENDEPRTAESLRDFILGMSDIGRMGARGILDAVDLGGYEHMIDVGGGPGTYSCEFLEKHAGMRATLMDRPEVIEIAREQIAGRGLSDRFAFVSGDALVDDMGSGYDLVLVSNIIHSYGPDTNRDLMRRCFECLKEGGLLVVHDFFTEDDRSGPPFALLFALHMLVHTAEGGTYSFAEIEDWTRQAGFSQGHRLRISPQSAVWLTRKT